MYLNTQSNGTDDYGHVRIHFCHASAGEDCCVVVIASKLPHHEKGPAEVVLASCKRFHRVQHRRRTELHEDGSGEKTCGWILAPGVELQSEGIVFSNHSIWLLKEALTQSLPPSPRRLKKWKSRAVAAV